MTDREAERLMRIGKGMSADEREALGCHLQSKGRERVKRADEGAELPFKCCGASDSPCPCWAESCQNPLNYPPYLLRRTKKWNT